MNNISDLDKQKFIFGSIFLIANRLQVLGDKYFEEDDMTTKQWLLTVMILQFKDNCPTLGEVAELMGTSHQNAKQIVLKLEKKGFLSIEKDERDGRAIRLKLTEKSYNFWERRAQKDDNYITELFKTLTHEETDNMYRAIGKIFGKIQEMGE